MKWGNFVEAARPTEIQLDPTPSQLAEVRRWRRLQSALLAVVVVAAPIFWLTDWMPDWLMYAMAPIGQAAMLCSLQAKQALRTPYHAKENTADFSGKQ
ncbi:hypothetical protein MW290_03055 [Aquincola tertiaricarbonis]|uniref:Uncharacterized protein n=1 Tax=Aquincola tertiaricarbonis TaxID=391953 RepID=A0ABY4S6R5_AQUTE|nr:hypothetical protein [Aquincola tertiaricarbonis]URI07616.1 hypothetical protein MW290_03055 [Aquincola tertiaricarbonis]